MTIFFALTLSLCAATLIVYVIYHAVQLIDRLIVFFATNWKGLLLTAWFVVIIFCLIGFINLL